MYPIFTCATPQSMRFIVSRTSCHPHPGLGLLLGRGLLAHEVEGGGTALAIGSFLTASRPSGSLRAWKRHARFRTATRNRPFAVLGLWDKHTMVRVGTMPFHRDFRQLPGSRLPRLGKEWKISCLGSDNISTETQLRLPEWMLNARTHSPLKTLSRLVQLAYSTLKMKLQPRICPFPVLIKFGLRRRGFCSLLRSGEEAPRHGSWAAHYCGAWTHNV